MAFITPYETKAGGVHAVTLATSHVLRDDFTLSRACELHYL